MKAYNQISQSAVYREDEISVTISVCGGSYGGGSETLVVGTILDNSYMYMTEGDEPIYTMQATDYKRGGA